MTNSDKWVNIGIEKTLAKIIDSIVEKKKDEFGRPLFESRSAFVDHAITEKLKKMEVAAK